MHPEPTSAAQRSLVAGALVVLVALASFATLLVPKPEDPVTVLMGLAQGIEHCAETATIVAPFQSRLPPSASPVPRDLQDVSGKSYRSVPSDWDAPAYACARVTMPNPQRFQYLWLRDLDDAGRVIARADLDGDGKVDRELFVTVSCYSDMCHVGRLIE